jgi:survival-of-motor-neuron-related-splicing factor 30
MEVELEGFEYQLSQVKLGLEADPSNAELLTLQSELVEIIDLTKQALGSTSAAKDAESTSKNKGKAKEKGFKAGEEVSARYKDMKWFVSFFASSSIPLLKSLVRMPIRLDRYPARITAISGTPDQPMYTLIFKGYTSPITLPPPCLRPLGSVPLESSAPAANTGVKRKLSQVEEEREKEKRKKKNEKWAEKQKEKTQETLQKKSAWESFGKKAAKKGVKIGGSVAR